MHPQNIPVHPQTKSTEPIATSHSLDHRIGAGRRHGRPSRWVFCASPLGAPEPGLRRVLFPTRPGCPSPYASPPGVDKGQARSRRLEPSCVACGNGKPVGPVARQHASDEPGQRPFFQVLLQAGTAPSSRRQRHAGAQIVSSGCTSSPAMTRALDAGRSDSDPTFVSSGVIQSAQHGPGFCRARPRRWRTLSVSWTLRPISASSETSLIRPCGFTADSRMSRISASMQRRCRAARTRLDR